VLNNVVVIATLVLFVLVSGPRAVTPASLSTSQQVVLGVGTTLGVVAMTAALLPSLRASGFRWASGSTCGEWGYVTLAGLRPGPLCMSRQPNWRFWS